ncbi:MAG: NAD(P)/FAD-dependent oxidoreductase [Muribaculaceae bacterium]|nr:NAD(P)/FAD-dependent oxidoreductase [Muribaculaceae bacterium]
MKTVVIAGAGPAGLTAADRLLEAGGFRVIVCEASDTVGGISRTVRCGSNRIDIGGHRFFSKNRRVVDKWLDIMPMQTAPALDERLCGKQSCDSDSLDGDPERSDRVMLRRRRVSRIYYLRRFFDYPVSLSMATLSAMGLKRTLRAGIGFLVERMRRRDIHTLEDFYISRFGRPLYSMFFEDYTRKVWGVHPSGLSADWGAQRVKGLSVTAVLRDMLRKSLGLKDRGKVETSLIEEFMYPKYGPGQLWETLADNIVERGAELLMQTEVRQVHIGGDGKVEAVTVADSEGRVSRIGCDCFMSSMPVCELVAGIRGCEVPEDVRRIAASLPYRDFITVGLLVDRLRIGNHTPLQTYGGRIPDTWIYVQERDVNLGRIQIFNNWSPYMTGDFAGSMWIGLEYFCNEGDGLWEKSDSDFIAMAINELESIGIIEAAAVRDSVRIKVRKAYPAYFGSYSEFDKVRHWLDTIPNLYCIGRNGQHRYNNMDHSMLTAMAAADAVIAGSSDHSAVWEVNTESEYHESTAGGSSAE